MSTLITCPNCKYEFETEEALSKSLEKQYEQKLDTEKSRLLGQMKNREEELAQQKKDFKEKKEKENQLFAERMKKELQKREVELQENLRKSISEDFENRVKILQEANQDQNEKLKLARQKELDFLNKERALKTKEEELEISLQKRLAEERKLLKEEILRQEKERNTIRESEHTLKIKELELKLESQAHLVDEMKRKASQGSMQLQGESQEIALEEMLGSTFPFDLIEEVGKGVRGADCIQTVRNQTGQECGKIIYESKRTENFGGDWIEKFKADMRSQGAEIAVLVTRTMPKDLDCFGLKEGVWVCTFGEVKPLAHVLRESVITVYNSAKKQEHKGDKMHLLYDFLTSHEFSEQWKAIREGFMSMKMSIQTERNAMERLWKAREKQLEKVLLNASHFKGSIEGIAGMDTLDLSLSDDMGLLEDV